MYIITHLSVGEQAGLYIWFTCSKKKGHPSARITLAVPRRFPVVRMFPFVYTIITSIKRISLFPGSSLTLRI